MIWIPMGVVTTPAAVAITANGHDNNPRTIGGRKERGTAPGNVLWSHCCQLPSVASLVHYSASLPTTRATAPRQRSATSGPSETQQTSQPTCSQLPGSRPYRNTSCAACSVKLSSTFVYGATRTCAVGTRRSSRNQRMYFRDILA